MAARIWHRHPLSTLRALPSPALQREYATSASEDFSSPLKKKEYRPPEPRSKLRYGMVTPQTLTEAGYSYGEGAPAALKFDPATTSIARMPTASEAVPMPATTTARAAMAEPVAYTAKAAELAAKGDATLLHTAFAPAAGGAGSLRVDRGKRSLGITGEVLRIGADPKSSTDAQRAWIQYRDPGIHAYRNVSANGLRRQRQQSVVVPAAANRSAPCIDHHHLPLL